MKLCRTVMMVCLVGIASSSAWAEEEPACYVGGCSGEVCSSELGVISACVWRDYFGCYDLEGATCGVLPSGECGWSGDSAFLGCLYERGACPYLSPPPPWWCEGGRIVPQGPNSVGCPQPAKCERAEGATCGGEYGFVCDEGLSCVDGLCQGA